jgi:DNA invertase Pin-like site-specific DNA recombinase
MILRIQKREVHVNLGDEEYSHLCAEAEKAGISKSEFLRCLIAEVDLKPRRPEQYIQIVRELNAIGNNLNQIARQANAFGLSGDTLAECHRLLLKARSIVRNEL